MDAASSTEKEFVMTAPFFSRVNVSVYFDPADQAFCETLDRFLAPLKQNDRIQTWDARHISAGQEWQGAYDQHLATDSLLILLISSHFLASETCLQQMHLALCRHQDGSAVIVPLLVHPCLWQETALHNLQFLPRTHKALSLETHPEAVWQEIVAEISRVIDTIQQRAVVIYAPEDQDVVERLQRDMAGSRVALWSLKSDQLSSDLTQHAGARDAMRQASGVVLIASPAVSSSRAVNTQMELAADYNRPVLIFWTKGDDDNQPRPEEWPAATLFDARSIRYEQARAMLVEWLKQQEIAAHSSSNPSAPLSEPRNPYKGLHAFTANDTRDFFGRERFVDDLLTRLEQTLAPQQQAKQQARLWAVVGASGSGKSSVVQAGLLPRLQSGAMRYSLQWIYLDPIVPGTHPLEALAISLAQQPSLGDVVALHKALTSDSLRTLHLLTSQLVASSTHKVVLFIDQFEEVFTLTASEEERQHFFDLLVTAVSEPRGSLLVLLTLRADFYEHTMRYPAFFCLVVALQVPVLAMEREDLRQIIEGPANLPDVQVNFEENLVGDLLFDMREQVGALPLLQFTLDQLFAHRSGHQLTRQAYREIGGVKGALTRHAEASYAALPSDAHRTLTRTLFLRLIDPGTTEQDTTRRRATFAEFALPDPTQTTILRETIDAFITARLLTANEHSGTITLEVSHEALIREWPRLIDWLREAREDIRLQQTISKDATEWQQSRHPKDHLYQGTKLKEAEQWAKRNTPSQYEAAFLRASAKQRIQFVVNTILVVLLILSISGTAGWFYLNREPNPTLVTTLQDNIVGSLRWAVAIVQSGSTITFNQSLWGHTIILNDDLVITKRHLNISGPEAGKVTISNKAHQIQVDTGTTLNISNLTFTGSKANHSSLLFNNGTLTLTNSIVSGNTDSGSSSGSFGGGIFNIQGGVLTLINSTVSGNSAVSNSDSSGGGIFNQGTLTLTNTTISSNTVFSSGSNFASGGGGISNDSFGTLTLTNSTISGNTASGSGSNFGSGGGGIDNQMGRLTLINSTISGNTASGSNGGGINNADTVTITFSTIYGNTAQNGGGIWTKQDPYTLTLDHVMMRNSLVTGNHASMHPDISGKLTSEGYNLLQNTSGITFLYPDHIPHTDITGTPLADLHVDTRLRHNGGPTLTLALLPGSPAIDVIPLDTCRITVIVPSTTMSTPVPQQQYTITTDQRGVARPQGSGCDIGAYEYAGLST